MNHYHRVRNVKWLQPTTLCFSFISDCPWTYRNVVFALKKSVILANVLAEIIFQYTMYEIFMKDKHTMRCFSCKMICELRGLVMNKLYMNSAVSNRHFYRLSLIVLIAYMMLTLLYLTYYLFNILQQLLNWWQYFLK